MLNLCSRICTWCRNDGGGEGEMLLSGLSIEADFRGLKLYFWSSATGFSPSSLLSPYSETSSTFPVISLCPMSTSRFTSPLLLEISSKSAETLRDIPGGMFNGSILAIYYYP